MKKFYHTEATIEKFTKQSYLSVGKNYTFVINHRPLLTTCVAVNDTTAIMKIGKNSPDGEGALIASTAGPVVLVNKNGNKNVDTVGLYHDASGFFVNAQTEEKVYNPVKVGDVIKSNKTSIILHVKYIASDGSLLAEYQKDGKLCTLFLSVNDECKSKFNLELRNETETTTKDDIYW